MVVASDAEAVRRASLKYQWMHGRDWSRWPRRAIR